MDSTAVNERSDSPILAALREKVSELNLTKLEVSRLCGKAPSTVSMVLNGKYSGRAEVVYEILEALDKIQSEEEIPTATKRSPKQTTGQAKKWLTSGQDLIYAILRLTYHTNGFSAIVGPSGLGKTHTAKLFASQYLDSAYIRCNDGMSMGDTIDALLDIVGLRISGTKTQKMKRAIQELKGKNIKMLMVDEADLLVSDYGNKSAVLKKISVFREVKEAGIGVAMIGLESFDDTLRVVGETYVTSRIDYFRRVDGPSRDELAYYLSHAGWDSELPESRQAISLAPQRGAFRFLEKLARSGKLLGSLKEALCVTYSAEGRVREV